MENGCHEWKLMTVNPTRKEHLEIRRGGYKTVIILILNSAEYKIFMLINVKMPTIIGILTFISMINTTSERHKARNIFICRYHSVY